MKNWISTRKFCREKVTENPHPYKYFEVQETVDGNRKFVESSPVLPSMAEDFSVTNNAIYRLGGVSPVRLSSDPVDVNERLSNVLN